MNYSLNSLGLGSKLLKRGLIEGRIVGVIKGDARSLDCRS